jgi:hypothetical protein
MGDEELHEMDSGPFFERFNGLGSFSFNSGSFSSGDFFRQVFAVLRRGGKDE